MHMKAFLTGLILLCVHTGAAALDGNTALEVDKPVAAPQSQPEPASMPE